ncbi:DMT family transporter [Methylorubrum sp. POS3]|uniref:DMT family transporter n=1 Tax=Methylorubrum sp. POS3 TaxID=2998492 RepID=UPI003728CF99
MLLLIPTGFAVLAGISVVTQQILNANLRTALSSAAWSGFASYFVGLACMAFLAVILRDPPPSAGVMLRVPWWAWSGGLFGAIFIGLAIVLVPQLGAATFIALVVTGQMLASAGFDHFGLLGLDRQPLDATRLLGIALLVGGVVLIRR